jgi:DNA repair protein RecN (Recombination protein N)
MLRELQIKNLAIIEDAVVEFGEGLNVLTGETGAGKSIIISALSLALGERASSSSVRSGKKEGSVRSFFEISSDDLDKVSAVDLEGLGIDTENGLILRRVVSSQGKSRAYINDSMVNLQTLSEISSSVIDIHGQYEHQSLLSPDNQLELLDLFGGLQKERQEVADLYASLTGLKQKISLLLQKEKERVQRIDMLEFQIEEIESAGVKPGEEEELEEEVKILGSAVRLAELANSAYDSLYASDAACIPNLSGVINDLKEISEIDSRAADALKTAEEALPLLEEVSYFLRDYKENLDFDPARLEQVQERLELIKRLKKKYGESIQDIIEHREKALIELEDLQYSEERLERLNKELDECRDSFTKKAQALSKKRKTAATKLEPKIISELAKLSMPDTQFKVSITHEEGDDTTDGHKAGPDGIDEVEFMISPNPGEALKPLTKIASGGELSRIMLALKGIMSESDRIPILVFDEIDAGIGGKTAEVVGKRLKALSSRHQVICITHLPQIASYADVHLKIEKSAVKGRTKVDIRRIEKEERTEEIARMLSGDTSEVSMKHAREMLKAKKR